MSQLRKTSNSDKAAFLRRLADLCEEFDASISYTNDDDGTHIEISGEQVFVGYLGSGNAPGELRDAANKFN